MTRILTLKANGIWRVYEQRGAKIFQSRAFFRELAELSQDGSAPFGLRVIQYRIFAYSKDLRRNFEISKRAASEWFHVIGYHSQLAAAVQVYGDQWLDSQEFQRKDLILEKVSPANWQLQEQWKSVSCDEEARDLDSLHPVPPIVAGRISGIPLTDTM